MAEINDLEIVDDDNTARFPEGQAPSTVNNAARQLEGIVARWHKDTNASKSSTGSANAYAFAADQTLTAYYDGLEIAFDANFTNDGAATLDVDGLGAQAITLVDGSALTGSEIVQGQKAIVIFDGTNWQLLNPSFSGLKSLPVGSTFPYVGTVAPSGFVLAEGRTIGNAASGGTERAADDTENLFTLIWDSTTDANAPVTPGGRGTDAASDFAANKTITLPDLRGRSVIGQGTGPDTADGGTAGEARANFEKGGAESYVLTTGQLPSGLQVYDGGSLLVGTDGSLITAASPTRTAAGSDDPIDQMHPWQALTNIISLGTGLTNGVGAGSRDASNDTVIATGGVTARTLANRAAEKADFRDFGIATGSVETTDIQTCINQAATAGVSVFVPEGTYLIDDRLVRNAPMEGADPQKCFIKADSTFRTQTSITFADTAINTGTDTINSTAHGFDDLEPVIFDNGGGTSPSPLVTGTVYWIILVDANNVKLATSRDDAVADTAVDLTTTGSGSSFSLTSKLMMLDFNGDPGTLNRGFNRNLAFDLNNRPNVRCWSSTSLTGSGGQNSSKSVHENIEILNGHHTAYAVDALTTTGLTSESGMLTGSVFNGFEIKQCPLAMRLGTNIDDVVFNALRIRLNGATQGSETLPAIDLACQNTVFNSWFLGAIGPLGYEFSGGDLTVRAPISLRAALNGIKIHKLFAESVGNSCDLTHIFNAEVNFNLDLQGITVNLDSPDARGILFNVIRAQANKRSSFFFHGITAPSASTQPLKRLIEYERVGNPSGGPADQGVEVKFSGFSEGFMHGWPFTTLNAAAQNENNAYLDLHGPVSRKAYDHEMTEGEVNTAAGTKVYEATFNAATAVNAGADTITVASHEFLTGDIAYYNRQGGTLIPGLTDLTTYYAIKVDADTIKLASTKSNAFAGTAVDITGTGTGTQSISRRHKINSLRVS